MQKRFLIIPLAIVAGLIFFVEVLFFLVPTRPVEEALKKGIQEQFGLVVSTNSFEKVFPFGYEARGVRLRDTRWSESLYLTRIRARFSPISLLRLRPGVVLSGDIYGGVLKGRLSRGMGAAYASINLGHAVVPPLEVPGKAELGIADIQLDITAQGQRGCPEGFIKARAKGGRLKAFSIMGLRIPEGKLTEEGLDIKFSKCKAYVKSAWIKGAAFEASANGIIGLASTLANAPMEMRIEVSPRGKLLEDLNKISLLRPYRRSSGYYRAVFRGTPSFPLIRAE